MLCLVSDRGELVTDSRAGRSVRWRLNHGEGTDAQSDAPRADATADFQHSTRPRDEDDIDGESHEPGMNTRARGEHERGATRETIPTEESPIAALAIEGANQRRREDRAGRKVLQPPRFMRRAQTGTQEMRVHPDAASATTASGAT